MDDLMTPAGPDRLGRPTSGWVRHARYEVRDGAVRPAPGAALEAYDPWTGYTEARAGRATTPAPYETLLELGWSLTPHIRPAERFGPATSLAPAGEAMVAAWCAGSGLLGILPHEIEMALLAPRWRQQAEAGRTRLWPARRRYSWGPQGWTAQDEFWPMVEPAFEALPGVEGDLVPEELLRQTWGEPSVVGRRLDWEHWVEYPLGLAFPPHFPDVPDQDVDTHDYPLPGTAPFWAAYAESVPAFVGGVLQFAGALMGLGEPPETPWVDGLGHTWDRARAMRALHRLLAAAQPVLRQQPEGGFGHAWRSKSLLATYALMAYLDLGDGKRVLRCDADGRPFVSGAYQARYCSERCSKRVLQRAWRRRVRERAAVDRVPLRRGDKEASHADWG